MRLGRTQHYVPQMMIRRFAGDDSKLTELIKPQLSFGSRRRAPRGVLFGEDFYRDCHSDLDEELFTPVEQRFAPVYAALADDRHPHLRDGKDAAAFVDWVASMLVRTRAFPLLAQAVGERHSALGKLFWKIMPELTNNVFRQMWFSELQDTLSRPLFRWKIIKYPPEQTVVLTDFPVCQSSGRALGGQVTVVPLSKHRVVFGGSEKAIAHWNIPADDLNGFLAGCAKRSIFAADRATLERVAKKLRGDDGQPADWCNAARRPFFGFLDRLNDMKSPGRADIGKWFTEYKDSYGDSILPLDRARPWPACSVFTEPIGSTP